MKIVGFFVAMTVALMIVAGRDLLSGYESGEGQVVVAGRWVALLLWPFGALANLLMYPNRNDSLPGGLSNERSSS